MKVIEIFLEKELGKNLGFRYNMENLFKNIDENTSKVIMNFEGAEFISRATAQEYLNQKHFASFEVIEKNVPEDVQKMFDIILELNGKKNRMEINLEEKYSKKLGVGPTAKKLFQEINEETSVILNFKNIEFMSRSFAQEYIFQKHNTKTDIEEINMDESIQKLLEVVEDDFNETCLNS